MDASSVSSSPEVSGGDTRKLIVELRDEVRLLESRVSALEHGAPLRLPQPPQPPVPSLPITDLRLSADVVPALGRALLGVAGAYLLRALTEINVMPRGFGVAAGIVYATLWLVFAARTPSQRPFRAGVNAATSILILGPLLWECAVRLHTMRAWSVAAILAVYCLGALALSWKIRLGVISAIAAPACAWIAIVLMVGTGALMPFMLALVLIAAAEEFSALFATALSTRWLVMIAADFGAFLLAMLVGRTGGIPEGYAPIPALAAAGLVALFAAIYASGALVRTVFRGRPLSISGILQTAIAFFIGLGGAWYITRASVVIGGFAIVTGAACYAISSGVAQRRNIYTYSIFAILLTVAGTRLLAPDRALVALWAVIAVALIVLNPGRLGALNAAAFLWLAAVVPPHAHFAILLATAIVYFFVVRRRNDRLPALLIAAVGVWSIAGLTLAEVRLSSAPTAALALCSIAMAAAGTRWRRPELIWLIYPTMAAAAWMMLARDFGAAATMPLVISLVIFGGALITLPRILRRKLT